VAAPSNRPAQDPRYRPFRIAAYALYLVVVSGFSLLVIRGVYGSVVAMTPRALPAAEVTLSVRECLERAEGLFGDMQKEHAKLIDTVPAAQADDVWDQFRVGWMERYRTAEASCALGSQSRARLRAVFEKLSRVMDLYTTAAVQYAGAMGGAIDGLIASLADA
jgi:hypothetical protein